MSGLTATGIYTEHDKHSLWIQQCNHALSLGEGELSDTYLNISKIITLAKQSGADAIHPGYGFLSENYKFAEACRQNNIIFIGPSPETLKIAGDKQLSNNMVQSLGIRVPDKITGSVEELTDHKRVLLFPLLAKAAAGGGGKGIRLITNRNELKHILKTITDEAQNYFGDERVYLEQYIENSRHIEIQILGDSYGNIVHLFERECSVQRRHQKLIEESPSVSLSNESRAAITDAALKIAAHLHYISAGTIEFLIDRNGNFYFLEINPRIQVEHGVTELVTRVDIIREQISIAAGNKLSFDQKDLKASGHAIEARIYSEDPETKMIPSPGKIHFISFPSDNSLRIDTGVENGAQIPADFDPLIAKILVHEDSRNAAINKMKNALDDTVITGLHHNLALHDLIFSDEDYMNNQINTTWLENKYTYFSDKLFLKRKSTDRVLVGITAALLVLDIKASETDSPWISGFWRNVRQIRFRYENQLLEFDFLRTGAGSIIFFYDDRTLAVSGIRLDNNRIEYSVDEQFYRWYIVPETNGIIEISDGHFEYRVERFQLRSDDFNAKDELTGSHSNTVLAPQPGIIVEIKVTEGQQVNRGDFLLTIESMKLENTILAVTGGIIKKINIRAGDKVRKNEPLIYLQEIITN